VSPIGRVAVLGAGTMGHGIAQVSAAAGCEVRLHDPVAEAAERGLERVRENLDKGVSLGKVTPPDRDATLGRLRPAVSVGEAVADADLVVEAAPESLDLKREIFRDVEAAAPDGTLLATNTSSLRVTDIAEVLADPARFFGLHFFNPVHLMKLVEVVRSPQTSRRALEAAVAFVRRLGKEPVVVKDAPGFASSRLGVALGMEAIRMVEQGVASAEDIDRVMELGYRHPVGPLKLTDMVGLDVRLDIAEYLHRTLGVETFRPPELLRRMVAEGKLGKKSGRGFYRWDE